MKAVEQFLEGFVDTLREGWRFKWEILGRVAGYALVVFLLVAAAAGAAAFLDFISNLPR